MERSRYEWPPSSRTMPADPAVVAPYESIDQAHGSSDSRHSDFADLRHGRPRSPPLRPRPSDYQWPVPTSSSQDSETPSNSMATVPQEGSTEIPQMENLLTTPGASRSRSPFQGHLPRRNVDLVERETIFRRLQRGEPSALAMTRPAPMESDLNKNHLSDLSTLVYVNSVDPHLMCAICYCPFDRPIKLPCDHYFCSKCIGQSLENQPTNAQTCPSCRSRISRKNIAPGSKIIEHMLEGLMIKCPLHKEGCDVEMTRGSAQNHLDRYCDFYEVKCPQYHCKLPVQRRHARDPMHRCLHQAVPCEDCKVQLMEVDVEAHREKYCSLGIVNCPDCKETVKRLELEAHTQECLEAIFSCEAVVYGCDFVGKRSILDPHQSACTLSRLVPFLKRHNEMLLEHDASLKHLQYKNSILETSFQTIQATLSPSCNLVDSPWPMPTTPTTAGGPFDSTAHHLLSLHESLREEVSRVSSVISELDNKATMMIMNESLRIKDELTHTNAAVGGMRHQLHWLVSARLQNEQRAAMVRAQTASRSSPPGAPAGSPSQGAAAGPSTGLRQPVRRLSDTTRQETKL